MTNVNRKIYKILAIFLLILNLFNVIEPVVFAISGSGSGTWVAGQFDSQIYTTDSSGNGVLLRRLVNKSTGEQLTVFCAEYGKDITTGVEYNGDYYTPKSSKIKKACKIAYFGWYSKYPDTIVNGGFTEPYMYWTLLDYVLTQQYIWEALGQSSATFRDSEIQRQYEQHKETIDAQIAEMEREPSFDGTTITVTKGKSQQVTDTNGVLAKYGSMNEIYDGVRIQHTKGQNYITITATDECTVENLRVSNAMMKAAGMIKDETKDHDTTVYFTFDSGVQEQLYALHYNDPVTLSFEVNIKSVGSLELTKTNTKKELINGAQFRLKGVNNDYDNVVEVTNGKITIENLEAGVYTLQEVKAPSPMLLDETIYEIEIVANEVTKKTVENVEPTGTFELTKKNSDGTKNLKGVTFRIWSEDNGYDKQFTTNTEGKIVVEGLKLRTL